MFRFNLKFALITTLILAIEICIAVFLKDGFIRYTFGDFLSTILVYCGLRSVTNLKPKLVALITLIIAFTLEGFQYINLLELVNLQDYKLLRIVLGSHFSFEDLLAYTLGTICAYIIDIRTNKDN